MRSGDGALVVVAFAALLAGCPMMVLDHRGQATGAGGSGADGAVTGGVDTAVGGSGGASGGGGCSQAEDCPGVDTTCRLRSCVADICGFADVAAGTACSDGGGLMCDGSGSCVECLAGSDCVDGVCQGNQCVAASCSDSVNNGDETDVDCGGSCAPCANGKQCLSVGDCTSSYCVDGVCCDAACTSSCEACDQAGTEGSCLPLPTGTLALACEPYLPLRRRVGRVSQRVRQPQRLLGGRLLLRRYLCLLRALRLR